MNNDLVFKIIKRTLIWSVFLIVVIFLLTLRNAKPYILGYIFGVLISILAFKLLHNSVNKSVMMEPNRARLYSTSQYFIRFIIYAVVLAIAGKADYLSLITTFLGLIMVKLVIVTTTIFDKNYLN